MKVRPGRGRAGDAPAFGSLFGTGGTSDSPCSADRLGRHIVGAKTAFEGAECLIAVTTQAAMRRSRTPAPEAPACIRLTESR